MKNIQVFKEFKIFVSKRIWYKPLGIDRFRASGVKRRFLTGELSFQTIVKYLNDANYKILALPPREPDEFNYTKYELTDKQIDLLTILGYFDNLTETPNCNSAIDYLRQRFEIQCAVNLCKKSNNKHMQYMYSGFYLDPCNNYRHHTGDFFPDYYSASNNLLDTLLSLNLLPN